MSKCTRNECHRVKRQLYFYDIPGIAKMIFPSVVLLIAICIANGESIPAQRELVFAKIGGYQPLTDVRDHVSDVELIARSTFFAQNRRLTYFFPKGFD
jgi:hypothetical protein